MMMQGRVGDSRELSFLPHNTHNTPTTTSTVLFFFVRLECIFYHIFAYSRFLVCPVVSLFSIPALDIWYSTLSVCHLFYSNLILFLFNAHLSLGFFLSPLFFHSFNYLFPSLPLFFIIPFDFPVKRWYDIVLTFFLFFFVGGLAWFTREKLKTVNHGCPSVCPSAHLVGDLVCHRTVFPPSLPAHMLFMVKSIPRVALCRVEGIACTVHCRRSMHSGRQSTLHCGVARGKLNPLVGYTLGSFVV